MTKENIVAQNKGHTVIADEFFTDEKGLREALGLWLHRVGEVDIPLRTVAQETLEERGVVGRGDDENLRDAGQHEHRERIVDHRLVVHRQQLFGDHTRDGVQARARTAGQDNALHDACLRFKYQSTVAAMP